MDQSAPETRWVLMPPVTYRYMDQQYIDEFFSTGRLMLSSFKQFSLHADEQRGDPLEGQNLVVGTAGNHYIAAQVGVSDRSLVFCTSVREDKELMRQFNCDGYFRIVDTAWFGRAIANRLQGCMEGIEGFCTYKDAHVIEKRLFPAVEGFLADNADGVKDLERVQEVVMGVAGAEGYFSKRRQFEHQSEYRIVWNFDRAVEDVVFVECPEAIQFCEKVTGNPVARREWTLAVPGSPEWPKSE